MSANLSEDLDASSSFRTLWSAVKASAHFWGSGRPSGSPWVFDFIVACWHVVELQTSHSVLLGKRVNTLCVLGGGATKGSFCFLLRFLDFTLSSGFPPALSSEICSRLPSAVMSIVWPEPFSFSNLGATCLVSSSGSYVAFLDCTHRQTNKSQIGNCSEGCWPYSFE